MSKKTPNHPPPPAIFNLVLSSPLIEQSPDKNDLTSELFVPQAAQHGHL